MVVQTAAEEIEEECGYAVDAVDVRPLGAAKSAIGTQGTDHLMFFARVSA